MFESTTATPSPLARCLEVAQLTLHATGVCLERLSERLTLVSIAAARESGRVQQLCDCLPELPDGGPLAEALGLAAAADALADVRTACSVQRESLDLLAGTAFSEADRVKEITSELLAILPGVRPAESFEDLAADPPPAPLPTQPSPTQPIAPPIIPAPTPAPNPAPPTPAATEEIVTTAANAGVLEVPPPSLSIAITTRKLQNDPNYIAACVEEDEAGGYIPEEVVEALSDAQSPPPDEDESQDEEADDLDEGTDLWKRTSGEMVREVFGEVPSDADEARAQVVASYPDARVITRRNGKRSGLKYLIVTGQGRQTSHLSDRRSSESGAWIDAAGRLPDLSSLSHS